MLAARFVCQAAEAVERNQRTRPARGTERRLDPRRVAALSAEYERLYPADE